VSRFVSSIASLKSSNTATYAIAPSMYMDDDDDDVYLRLQHGKGFHNLVYMSHVKHMNTAISDGHNNSKHLCNNLIVNKASLT
jgi:hypothetical protein